MLNSLQERNNHEMQRENTELKELVQALAWNDAFGCHTRAGFEKYIWPTIATRARWIIYFDIDGMHNLNAEHGGYDYADGLIKKSLSILREGDYVAGQWKSGDEFLVCLAESEEEHLAGQSGERRGDFDPHGLMERLKAELEKHGLGATFAIVAAISLDLKVNVEPAERQVYAIKNSRPNKDRR